MISILKTMTLTLLALSFATAIAQRTPEYQRLKNNCRSCTELEKITVAHSKELSSDARLKLALQMAKVIEGIVLKGEPKTEQMREIYFSINSSLQVLRDDFDSETVVRLMDLRAVEPKVFDEVFWRFDISQQKRLIERMAALKDDKIRPKAVIPKAKTVEQ
jgi:hypothetical protein